jgi:hypothetical protein
MPQINPPQTTATIVYATPSELIVTALQLIGVVGFGMAASSREIADGLIHLNLMLDQWSVARENISVRREDVFSLVVGQSTYYIGKGAVDFDTERPIKIESAFYRDSNNSDFELDVTMQEKDYSEIVLKNVTGSATRLFYKPSYPFGVIQFDYAPDNAYSLYIKSWKPFAKITDPADQTQLAFPDGFEAALTYNLAKRLCPPNKKVCPAEVNEIAMTSLQDVQAAYSEIRTIVNWDTPKAKARKGSFFDMNGGQ